MWTSPYEVVDFFSPKKCLLMEVWGGKGGGGGGGRNEPPVQAIPIVRMK